MIKLCSTVARISILSGGSLCTKVHLQSVRNNLKLLTENVNAKCYLRTAATHFDKDDDKSLPENLSTEEAGKEADESTPLKILLVEKGRKVGIMTLAEAQHIAKSRNRRLSKVEQPGKRSNQDVYHLLTNSQWLQEESKSTTKEEPQSVGSKGTKNVVIGAKITDHDLGIKANSMKKWLAQKYTVRVSVNNNEENAAEKIFAVLEKAAQEAGGKTSSKNKSSDGATLKVVFQCNKSSTS